MTTQPRLKFQPVLWSAIVYWLLSLTYVIAGRLHLDEGAYLYAARSVYRGEILYRDFFFLQPPLHPYIYGIPQLIFPGLLAGRLTSLFLGLIATVLLIRTAIRLGGRNAGIITLAIIASNSFQIYFFTITRLYSLTCLLLVLGCCFLVSRHELTPVRATLSLMSFALALGTRLTTLPVFCLALLYVIIQSRTLRGKLIPGLLSILVLLAIFLPFAYLAGPDRLWFNLLGMNLSLHSHDLTANLLQKARATSQLVRFYFLAFVMSIPLIPIYFQRIRNQSFREFLRDVTSIRGFLWVLTLGLLSVHTIAKIYQVSYQTIVMPIFIMMTAVEWSRIYSDSAPETRRVFKYLLLAGCVLSVLAYGRESLSIIDGKPAYMALREQAQFVKDHSETSHRIFSADSALIAVEADRRLLTGMAGSDLFPDWTTEQCQHFNVLNFDIMESYVNEKSGRILIHGDRSFSLSLPYLKPIHPGKREAFLKLVKSRYTLEKVFSNLYIPGSKTYYYLANDDK